MNIVIIEDEPLLAEDLKQYICSSGMPCEVIAILPSIKDARAFFSAHYDYQVIFSDIQLGDGLSFDIFKQTEIKAPVIFCTAYNQYAIEAFKNNGIGYLLKPFGQEAVNEALQKYDLLKLNIAQSLKGYQGISKALSQNISTSVPSALLVNHRDKIIPVKHEEVALSFIRNGTVHLLDFQKNMFFVNYTLDELEVIFGKTFFRADRQHLVNRKAIKDVSQFLSRKLKLNLSVDYATLIAIRKEKTSEFLGWLSQN
jgi:two-component system, LytTR family, response regulator LytT